MAFFQGAFFALVILFESALGVIKPAPQTVNLDVSVTPDYKAEVKTPVYFVPKAEAKEVIKDPVVTPVEAPKMPLEAPINVPVQTPVPTIVLEPVPEPIKCDETVKSATYVTEDFVWSETGMTKTFPVKLTSTCKDEKKWFVDFTTPSGEKKDIPLKFNGVNDAGLATYVADQEVVGSRLYYTTTVSGKQEFTFFFHSPDTHLTVTHKAEVNFDPCHYVPSMCR